MMLARYHLVFDIQYVTITYLYGSNLTAIASCFWRHHDHGWAVALKKLWHGEKKFRDKKSEPEYLLEWLVNH
jgi:hypothetical protein